MYVNTYFILSILSIYTCIYACKMSLIQNMMGILLEICIFFKYSAKRQGLLEENITKMYSDMMLC